MSWYSPPNNITPECEEVLRSAANSGSSEAQAMVELLCSVAESAAYEALAPSEVEILMLSSASELQDWAESFGHQLLLAKSKKGLDETTPG